MSKSGKIESDKIIIREVFEKFWFEIPNYQRHYVWDEDNVFQLLDDIKTHYDLNKDKKNKDKEEYFLGSLVLQKKDSDMDFAVLDGQQRLTTLLLLLSVIRDLTNNKNCRDSYIKEAANPDKRIYSSKNRINFEIRDNIKEFCQKYIFDYNEPLDIENKYKEIGTYKNSKNISLKNMSNALITIRKFLSQFDELELDAYFNTLINDVVLIYVSTEDKEDAYRLFTILNSRGVPLSSADILKSINLGALDDSIQQEYAEKWEKIEDSFGEDDFDRFLSHLRAILIRQKAKTTLLNEFENIVYNKEKPLLKKGVETIDFIEKYNNIYNKIILLDSIDEKGCNNDLSNEFKNLVHILRAAFSSTDWIPPLLMYYEKFGNDRLIDFLKKLESKALSDIICRESTTKRMDSFYKIMDLIIYSSTTSEILDSSNNALVNFNKDYAKHIIESEGIYGRVFDKYILLKYEYLNWDNTVVVSDYNNLSIEHVLPQTPPSKSAWLNIFDKDNVERWTHNIANLIIINGRKNSALSNLDFSEKKIKLQNKIKDIFKGSSEILNTEEWTPETLSLRNSNMCDLLFKE